MDDYYSKLNVSDDLDNDTLFKEYVVMDTEDLEHIDNLLKLCFQEIDD